jgi:hypothetical protein
MHRAANTIVLASFALACLAASCLGQGTIQIGFNGQPLGSYTSPVGSYSESGVQVTGVQSGAFALVGGSLTGYPDNGTGDLQLPGGAGLTFSFTPLAALAQTCTILYSGPTT